MVASSLKIWKSMLMIQIKQTKYKKVNQKRIKSASTEETKKINECFEQEKDEGNEDANNESNNMLEEDLPTD